MTYCGNKSNISKFNTADIKRKQNIDHANTKRRISQKEKKLMYRD